MTEKLSVIEILENAKYNIENGNKTHIVGFFAIAISQIDSAIKILQDKQWQEK